MKKILFSLVILLSVNTTFAKFAVDEIPPQCLINGITITTTGNYVSDTSSWQIPAAYEGNCREVSELSEKQKEAVYTKFFNYFSQKKYLNTPRIIDLWDWTTKEFISMNEQGRKFINDTYFPVLKKAILAEIAKQNPNDKRIALYQYAVQIIGYDYELQK